MSNADQTNGDRTYSIRQLCQRLRGEGLRISESKIGALIRSGKLRHVTAGTGKRPRYLIRYSWWIEYLDRESVAPTEPRRRRVTPPRKRNFIQRPDNDGR